jgi:hypothetical protein
VLLGLFDNSLKVLDKNKEIKAFEIIKTETDPSGGTTYTITGTSQLLSVPYALYAKTSESSNDGVKLTGDQTISGNKTFGGTTSTITELFDSGIITAPQRLRIIYIYVLNLIHHLLTKSNI